MPSTAWKPSGAANSRSRKPATPATQPAVAVSGPADGNSDTAGTSAAERKPVTSLRASAPAAASGEDADEYRPPTDTRLDVTWHLEYLRVLEENGGQKTAAVKAAGVTLKTLAKHRTMLATFEKAEQDVLKLSMETAEAEARRRAIDGVETIYRRIERTTDGKETIHEHVERKYSDTILLRLLTRLERGTWVESKQMEHSGGLTFKTRAERKAALEQARAAKQQQPVTAIHGRS